MSRDLLKFWQISVDISKIVQDRDTLPMEDNRKSYMAYQMAQTPVTLNVLEGHFSYLTLFNLLLENKTHSKFDVCIRIGERTCGLRP